MKQIKYQRYEFLGNPETRKANLLVFIYDIPYFGACGIFPPFHIINQIFASGGSDGGMSPGATWKPFTLSVAEYDELTKQVQEINPQILASEARYTMIKFEFDHRFNYMKTWQSWIFAVCEQHRQSYHRKIEKHQQI